MEKKFSKFLSVILAVMMLLSAVPFWASADTSGYYTYTVSDGTATITDVSEDISGDITIPEMLGGYPVKEIGERAFEDCVGITGITVSEGIEAIGNEAFSGTSAEQLFIPASVNKLGTMLCFESKLKKYVVDEENSYYSSDEYGVLFNKTKTKLLDYPCLSACTVYTVPDTVEVIGAYSFSSQFTVKELIMPDSVKEIENEAFYGCAALEKIRLSENLHTIGNQNFYFCFYLKELSLPASVKFVGEESFIELYALDKITIYSKDVDLTDTYLGYHGLGESAEDHKEIADIYYEHFYTYYCLGDIEKAEVIAEQLYNYGFTENNYANSYPVYCYKGSTAEEYAKTYGLEYFYMCEAHIPEVIDAVKETCVDSGYSEGSMCSVCKEILIAPTKIPATGHSLGEWENDYDNSIATRSCENCDYSESKELTNQGNGDVDIIAPEIPDLDFDIDSVEKNNKTFLLVEQSIKENTSGKADVLKVFDITLKNKDGVHVQPDGTVKVKLPLDWEGEKNYKVYRVNDDGSLTDMKAIQDGSHLVFETDHFSIYVIVEESEETTEDNTLNGKKDVFGFLIKLINALKDFFIRMLDILGV